MDEPKQPRKSFHWRMVAQKAEWRQGAPPTARGLAGQSIVPPAYCGTRPYLIDCTTFQRKRTVAMRLPSPRS